MLKRQLSFLVAKDASPCHAANLTTMTDEPQESQDRKDRDRERSDEARGALAEEGAENEPRQKTEKGPEIPVPQREDFLGNLGKVSKPEK